MLRYAITDRLLYAGDSGVQLEALIAQATRLAQDGVEYLQLREKDLPVHTRVALAIRLQAAIAGSATKLIVSGEPSLASLAGADGVHLPGSLLLRSWRAADFMVNGRKLLVSVSCHTLAEVDRARGFADVLLFGPVFGKTVRGTHVGDGVGLEALREACHVAGDVPVLALGGVDAQSVSECIDAGAAGIAAIRMFS
jgi:thiamine-phosphate pyrophosphorylase